MVMKEHDVGNAGSSFLDLESLKNEVEDLRNSLMEQVLIRDELLFVECKDIEVTYMFFLGELEYQVVKEQCSYLRIKRKVELIRGRLIRQEPVQLAQIEKRLDYELEKYQEILDDQLEELYEAIATYKVGQLSEEDNKELKKYYRLIAMKMYPDLYLNLSNNQIEVFNQAVSAYKSRDLQTLKLISDMLGDCVETQAEPTTIKKLVAERSRLKMQVATARTNIEAIKSEYPYTEKDLIKDSIQIEERKEKLEAIVRQFQEAYRVHQSMLAKLMR